MAVGHFAVKDFMVLRILCGRWNNFMFWTVYQTNDVVNRCFIRLFYYLSCAVQEGDRERRRWRDSSSSRVVTSLLFKVFWGFSDLLFVLLYFKIVSLKECVCGFRNDLTNSFCILGVSLWARCLVSKA